MAHGVTLLMRNIRRPAPIVIARHIGAPRRVRRSRRSEWKGSYVTNYPYVNPARDARPGRRIRSES